MSEVNHPPGRIRFGAYELDPPAGELRKYGVPIRLQAQPFRVLELLVERPGEIVTREELKQKLWRAEAFGDFDHGLNKAINKIREALNDSASGPRYIETVARRGYRFIGEVVRVTEAPNSPSAANPEVEAGITESDRHEVSRHRRFNPLLWKWALAVSLLLVACLFAWRFVGRPEGADAAIRSLAVLPMENLSNDISQEYFADGMTDELITALGTISGLRVISRTSVMPYKHAARPLREIARELQVDVVVEGTVLRVGEQVRITAQLIRARNDQNVWSQSYHGELRDALQLQDRIATDIARHIRLNLTAQERTLLSDTRPIDPLAYDDYLKGRYFWNKRTLQGLNRAIEYFGQAISKEADYAQAFSGLADAYALLGDWEYGQLSPQEALPRAKNAASKALALDNRLGEAHASLAFCLDLFNWDWNAADLEFQRSINLSPSYATGHQWYAWHLMMLGRNREGMEELRKAERLDPLSLIVGADVADALLIAHRYPESIHQSRKVIEMDPSFAVAHYQLGQALVQIGQYNDAIREFQEAMELSRGNPICTSSLAHVYAISGRRNEALAILDRLKKEWEAKHSNAASIALIYTGLQNKEEAFTWLQKAYEQRFNPSILLRPAFDPLRSDGRFQTLLRRLKLPVAAAN